MMHLLRPAGGGGAAGGDSGRRGGGGGTSGTSNKSPPTRAPGPKSSARHTQPHTHAHMPRRPPSQCVTAILMVVHDYTHRHHTTLLRCMEDTLSAHARRAQGRSPRTTSRTGTNHTASLGCRQGATCGGERRGGGVTRMQHTVRPCWATATRVGGAHTLSRHMQGASKAGGAEGGQVVILGWLAPLQPLGKELCHPPSMKGPVSWRSSAAGGGGNEKACAQRKGERRGGRPRLQAHNGVSHFGVAAMPPVRMQPAPLSTAPKPRYTSI
jgi:hypothetical protein